MRKATLFLSSPLTFCRLKAVTKWVTLKAVSPYFSAEGLEGKREKIGVAWNWESTP